MPPKIKTAHYYPCLHMTYESKPQGIFQNELLMHSLGRQAKLQNINNNRAIIRNSRHTWEWDKCCIFRANSKSRKFEFWEIGCKIAPKKVAFFPAVWLKNYNTFWCTFATYFPVWSGYLVQSEIFKDPTFYIIKFTYLISM